MAEIDFTPDETKIDFQPDQKQGTTTGQKVATGLGTAIRIVGGGLQAIPSVAELTPAAPAAAAVGAGIVGGTDLLAQAVERLGGARKSFSLPELGVAAAAGAIPLGGLARLGFVARTSIRAAQGAAIGAGATEATSLLESGKFVPGKELGEAAAIGGAFGGAAEGLLKVAPTLREIIFGKRAAAPEAVTQPGESGFVLQSAKAASEVQPKEVIPSATEERKVQESAPTERPRDDTRGTPTEAGVSGVVPGAAEVPQEAVTPAAQPRPVDPAQAQIHADIPADGGFSDHPLIQFLRDEVGGILSRSGARSKLGKEAFEGNKSLWDSAPEFPDPRHNKVYNSKSGVMPDEAASAAVEAGLLPQGADASTLFSEIQDISDNSHRLAKTGREARATIQTGEKQYKSFTAAAAKQEKGEAPINASQLNVGDTVTVKGEPMKVTGVDPDNYDVTLEDGTRFGIQHVADNEVFYGEHEPVTGKGGEQPVEEIKQVQTEETKGQGNEGRVLEPAAAEKPPAPAAGEPSLGGIKQTVAERRSGIEPGRGWTPQEAIEHGEIELKKGRAPEPIFEKAYTTGSLTGDEMAVARAQIRRLEQATDKANDDLYKDPNDPTLQANVDAADKAEKMARARLKPAQTDWQKQGAAQQYETEVDTGSIHGLRRFFQSINQRDVTPEELPGIEKQAAKSAKAKEAEAEARQKWGDEVGKLTKATKPRTREELVNHFAERLKQLLPCKT